jgi:hypothetical protein
MEQLASHWTILIEVDIGVFFENLSRKCSYVKDGQE